MPTGYAMPTEDERRAEEADRRRAMFDPRPGPSGIIPTIATAPRRVHVQRTEARHRGEPGGEMGTIAWEEWREACASVRHVDAEMTAARGGIDYAAVVMMLGREPRTWERWGT